MKKLLLIITLFLIIKNVYASVNSLSGDLQDKKDRVAEILRKIDIFYQRLDQNQQFISYEDFTNLLKPGNVTVRFLKHEETVAEDLLENLDRAEQEQEALDFQNELSRDVSNALARYEHCISQLARDLRRKKNILKSLIG
jgi:hypothetical protein